ncbi:MAG: AmmeMemoRadiSam system protein B [Desulfobacterales bacterium]|nr:AmmeMemoRadiSam system protein B [Desulfobacterales bacterium]
MKERKHEIISVLLMTLLSFLPAYYTAPCLPAHAGSIREPAFAGSFYPDASGQLSALIKQYVSQVKPVQFNRPPNTSLKALIIPHAGYVYAGWTAAHISLVVNGDRFGRIIVMGPDHRIGFEGCAVSDAAAWETPLGRIRLDPGADRLRQNKHLFRAIPASDRLEHSVEVVLPYLQYFFKKFKFVPMVFGRGQDLAEQASAVLDRLVDQNTLIVASSDLSHYLPYQKAIAWDQGTIESILTLNTGKLKMRENAACGKVPILVLMDMARRRHWKPVLLHYSNSGDTAGDRLRVVGYASIAFYGGSDMKNHGGSFQSLNEHQGQTLVKLARQTIAKKLGKRSAEVDADALADPAFQMKRGTFVTLTINQRLRGCIGNLEGRDSLVAGVERNAVNAAFHDPRFSPLKADELDRVDIEVSILTEPRSLEYKDGNELISKLRVHVDGVILQKGPFGATFLPQVWEQLPKPESFLSHLCMKAGLPADTWKTEHLDISTYQVQYFEEEK